MSIPFTQYLRPTGRQVPQYIQRGDKAEAQAKSCIDAGYRFEIEVLGNGLISMTSMFRDEEETIAIQIGPNDSKIPALVDSLVQMTFDNMRERADV